ncbi:MAG: hypothetical protein L6Q29_04360 [Candidatus Pacebacteria bacterium]|nr:hypothetical protein [Candidatus Paceibacterota bacterium]
MAKSSQNDIELELRAEISNIKFNSLLDKLRQTAKLTSRSKRLSVMFLGEINKLNFDIRARISSGGKAEIVLKKGDFHAHNRVESSQEINPNQFLGIVKILSNFNFQSKVTERENFVFDLNNNMCLVLVKANNIFYAEIEKMSSAEELEENRKQLIETLSELGLKPINETQFNELCNRLTKKSDWIFEGSQAHFKKLENMLKGY